MRIAASMFHCSIPFILTRSHEHMPQPLHIHLKWEGVETIKAIEPVLGQPCLIELALAANYHHAIFCQLHPDAPPGPLEVLQEQGGGELLATLGGVEGLQPLAQLADAVTQAKGTVKIGQPAVVTIEIPGEAVSAAHCSRPSAHDRRPRRHASGESAKVSRTLQDARTRSCACPSSTNSKTSCCTTPARPSPTTT